MASLIDDSGTTRFEGTIPGAQLFRRVFDLSAADIIGATVLTPFELMPSPGASKAILPVFVNALYTAGATPFDAGNGFDLIFGPEPDAVNSDTGEVYSVLINTNGFLSASTNQFRMGNIPSIHVPVTPATVLDQPFVLVVNNPLTTGDGSVRAEVFYVVADFS